MAHVELSPEEVAVLLEVLDERLHELRREIHHTDNRDFKAYLLRQEELLAGLTARLGQPAAAT